MEEVVISEQGDPLGADQDGDHVQNFNCEQSGDVEGSADILVNFTEDSIPCLICGVDLQLDGVVKQEVDVEGDGGGGVNDGEVFQWFLKWFRLNSKKKNKLTSVKERNYRYYGKILKFCVTCKMELIRIVNLEREVDQLGKQIKNGLEEVKGKMEVCEGNFIISGVYERDCSFKRIRSLIIKCGKIKYVLRRLFSE